MLVPYLLVSLRTVSRGNTSSGKAVCFRFALCDPEQGTDVQASPHTRAAVCRACIHVTATLPSPAVAHRCTKRTISVVTSSVSVRAKPRVSPRRTWILTAFGTILFACVHSLLASNSAKDTVAAVVGTRRCEIGYRAFYNLQALGATVYLLLWLRRLPDGIVYEVRGPASWLMRALQAGSLIALACCLRSVGLLNFLGISQLSQLVLPSREAGPRFVEAQGPALDHHGRIIVTGPFRLHRHPVNFWPVAILWLQPRMTHVGAAFAAIVTLYMVAGSYHQDLRLRRAYGPQYAGYRAAGIPLFFPRVHGYGTRTATLTARVERMPLRGSGVAPRGRQDPRLAFADYGYRIICRRECGSMCQ